MSTKQEYNGWYNYETWLANLWLTNDYNDYAFWEERADDLATEHDTLDDIIDALAEELEANFDAQAEELPVTGFFADAINASLREVEWHDIAKHMVNDRIEELTEIMSPTPEPEEIE